MLNDAAGMLRTHARRGNNGSRRRFCDVFAAGRGDSHYSLEFLRMVSGVAGGLSIPGRARILVIIVGVLIAHLVEVTLYAAAYYATETWMGLGRIDGEIEGGPLDLFYFSITTYTTLGVGDLHPRGQLRLIEPAWSLSMAWY
jgi:hypothetical protein